MLFFDTSALAKRYSREPGTDAVDELIEDPDQPAIISTLSIIELASALRRKQNTGELTERLRDDLLVAFFEEAIETFTITPIDDAAFERAFDLVLENDLRTLDALQLGTAMELSVPSFEITFVCADRGLVDTATARGLSTIDPTEEPCPDSD